MMAHTAARDFSPLSALGVDAAAADALPRTSTRIVYVQLERDVDLDAGAARLGLDCIGLFDHVANVHACRRSSSGDPADTAADAPLPPAGRGGVMCSSWEPNVCTAATSLPAVSVAVALPSPLPTDADAPDDLVLDGITMTYEQCVATLPRGGKPKTLALPLEWVHIPKCGTSFGATIYGYLCTADETPFYSPLEPQVNCTCVLTSLCTLLATTAGGVGGVREVGDTVLAHHHASIICVGVY